MKSMSSTCGAKASRRRRGCCLFLGDGFSRPSPGPGGRVRSPSPSRVRAPASSLVRRRAARARAARARRLREILHRCDIARRTLDGARDAGPGSARRARPLAGTAVGVARAFASSAGSDAFNMQRRAPLAPKSPLLRGHATDSFIPEGCACSANAAAASPRGQSRAIEQALKWGPLGAAPAGLGPASPRQLRSSRATPHSSPSLPAALVSARS